VAKGAQAKRYAQAVFQIAEQGNDLDKWLSDLEELSSLHGNDAFVRALESPNISFGDKGKLLADRFPDISVLATNLVNLLVERRAVGLLPGIFDEYRRLVDAHRGIERAEVITAVPLTEEDIGEIQRRLSVITGKQVAITANTDPAVIGGVVARFGGKLLDGSTRSRLEALKKEISEIPR
jgi:F-type H+-transporting ATPase subunit delta